MVDQVMTRQAFYAKYPAFAALPWGSPKRDAWLAAHPGAAAQWSALRQVEQTMTQRYGEDWRSQTNTAQVRWDRTVADFLDGGFSQPASPVPGVAPAPGAAPAGSGAGTTDPLTGEQRNAYDALVGIFNQYGLGTLAPTILSLVQRGFTDAGTIEVLLRETPEYKERFKANQQRIAAGLNALDIGTYLRLENEYASILRGSGLPQGFYDSRDDFTNWIAGDVSPDEIRERVGMAQQATLSSDPTIRRALSDYYNLGESDLVAYFLDPSRATTLFETRRTYATAQVGSAAMQQGLSVSRDRAQLFADQGVTADAARQGFAAVKTTLAASQRLSDIYDGEDVGQSTLEDEFLGGLASARRARERLAEKEVASFSGSSGVSRTSLSRRKRGAY